MNEYVGFDLHKSYSYVTAMNKDGKIIAAQGKIDNKETDILNYLSQFENPKITVEATLNWYWLIDLLQDNNFEITLAHPKKAKAIASAKIKSDKLSSKILADLLRSNLIPACYIPDRETRTLRDFLRHRAVLVIIKSSLKNRIHALLRNFNFHCPYSDLFGKSGRAWLKQVPLKPYCKISVDNFLSIIDTIEPKIDEVTKIIKELAGRNYYACLLDEIPGIDYYSALLIVLEIGDIKRFPDHRHLCSYIGIVPSAHKSGEINYTGKITKEGNSWLRWITVEAAQKAQLNPGNPYHQLFLEIEHKKGSAIAKVAVAKKIATAIYYMLSKNEHFKLPKSIGQRYSRVNPNYTVA
jgi:transposase